MTWFRLWIWVALSLAAMVLLQPQWTGSLIWIFGWGTGFVLLTRYFFAPRWMYRGAAFRYFAFFALAPLYAYEFNAVYFFWLILAFELLWHWAEEFHHTGQVLPVLLSGSLLGVLLILYRDSSAPVLLATLTLWFTVPPTQLKTWVQLLFATLIPVVLWWEWNYVFSDPPVWQWPPIQLNTVVWNWWIVPAVSTMLLLRQTVFSWKKANRLNRRRTIAMSFWTLLGAGGALLFGWPEAHALFLFSLSYLLANALFFTKEQRWVSLIIAALLLFEVIQLGQWLVF